MEAKGATPVPPATHQDGPSQSQKAPKGTEARMGSPGLRPASRGVSSPSGTRS